MITFTHYPSADQTNEERVATLSAWAEQHGCTLDLDGEIGFGRACVGISTAHSYVSTGNTPYRIEPPNAYHKDRYLAVLTDGISKAEAIEQLYDWVALIDLLQYVVEMKKKSSLDFGALFGIDSEPVLVKA